MRRGRKLPAELWLAKWLVILFTVGPVTGCWYAPFCLCTAEETDDPNDGCNASDEPYIDYFSVSSPNDGFAHTGPITITVTVETSNNGGALVHVYERDGTGALLVDMWTTEGRSDRTWTPQGDAREITLEITASIDGAGSSEMVTRVFTWSPQ
jgi:hypothetical protein